MAGLGEILRGGMRRGGLAAIAFTLLVVPLAANARDLTEAEKASLAETVQSFNAAMRGGDYARVVDTIPPRMLQHMAEGAGMEVATLRQMVIDMTTAAMADGILISFGMDIGKADYPSLDDGTPYALIPTETVLRPDPSKEEKTRISSKTLGLLDGTNWYLVRVSEAQQVNILRQVYPGFANVDFPAGTMEAVD